MLGRIRNLIHQAHETERPVSDFSDNAPPPLHSPAELHQFETSRPVVDGKFLRRDGRRFEAHGVTYGPFAPNAAREPFPARQRVCADFAAMRATGVNAVRTYHVPPAWLLALADECGLAVLIDVPWPKHLCFLDSLDAQRQARAAVREAAERGRDHPCVLAYSICNEIPANIVRWHGASRVERFLRELADVSKQADPAGLITYANYPSTEYLELPFLDFATFNVYLHDLGVFRRYLFRLQNRVGDMPLVLGEIGMDTLRHTEEEQAAFLAGHLREARLLGVASAFVFAWTDDWHTGGFQIEDWAFGITRRDRSPKPACRAVEEVRETAAFGLLTEAPRVSVVVCSYNGASTLDECLRSLERLDYPDYEVILVDDGSTDGTMDIAARHPEVRAIHQSNQGLSAARNAGLHAASGSVIAYTDSDCFADPEWLTHLVYQLTASGAAAVGGPNLTPEDGWLAACVAASPGQPTHVLESDQVAEHIPGCNMAFRREALEAINGFRTKYRKAGDDVDVCWRLQQSGMAITFAPAAFVWHHRRQNVRTYLRQQAGYGEAEALLWFDHPDRFNVRGEGRWRGVVYGVGLAGVRLGRPVIYRDTFGSGMFQTLYQPGPAHWAMLPSTLEWHMLMVALACVAPLWPTALAVVAAMWLASIAIAVVQACQARLPARHGGLGARALVAALSYAQPLVRSLARYRGRLFPPRIPAPELERSTVCAGALPFSGRQTTGFWDEAWRERTELLDRIVRYFGDHRWAIKIDSGWTEFDAEIVCHPWTVLQLCTAQEDHGGGRRLIRVRYRLRPSEDLGMLLAGTAAAAICA